MKKVIASILAILTLLLAVIPAASVGAATATEVITMTHTLSVEGSSDITVSSGDIITVLYTITPSEKAPTVASQNQIVFDEDFFDFVENSNKVIDESFTTSLNTNIAGTFMIYFNTGTSMTYRRVKEIGQFQLKVTAKSGTGYVHNTTYSVSDDTTPRPVNYPCEAVDLKVTIGGGDNPPPTPGGEDTPITKPTPDTTTFTYDGNPKTYSPVGFDSNTMTITGAEKTDAGEYTVTVTPKTGYKWSTEGDCEFTFKINKANQTITAADPQSFALIAESPAVVASTDGDGALTYAVASGTSASVNPSTGALTLNSTGDTTITVTAAATANYNSATKTITVTVTPPTIAKPTADTTTFTYDGNPKTYSPVGFDSAAMNIVGNVQTDADEYTVTVTPKEGYTWIGGGNEPVNFTFEIAKGEPEIVADNQTVYYGDTGKTVGATCDAGAVTYSVKSGNSVFVDPATGALTIVSLGETQIIVTFAGSDNYEVGEKTVVITVAPKEIAAPTADTSSFTYNAAPQTYMPQNYNSDTMSISNNIQTNAGTYTVTVTPKQNYAWADGSGTEAKTFTFEINKAEQAILGDNKTFTFGDTGKSVGALCNTGTIAYSIVSGNSVSVNSSTGALTINSVGDTTILMTVEGTANLKKIEKTVVVTIEPKKIAVPTDNLMTPYYDGGSKTYTPNGFDPATMEITDNIATDAGTYTAHVTPKANYAWADDSGTVTKDYNFTIARAKIAAPTADTTTFTYDGSPKTYMPNGFDGDKMTVSNNVKTDAGTYTVSVSPKANYEWADDSTTAKTFSFVIGKTNYTGITLTASGTIDRANGSTVQITLPALPQGASYGTPSKSNADDKYILSGISGQTIKATSAGIDAATNSMTFTIPVVADANHNGYSITVTLNCHDHVGTHQDGKDPEEFKAGYKEYYSCECGKFFEDEDCTIVIANLNAWKSDGGRGYIPMLHQHQIVKHEGKPATDKAAGYVEYYECGCGKLFEDATGTVEIEDLEEWIAAGGNGYVAPIGEDKPEEKPEEKPDSPKTGDTANLTLWVVCAVISLCAFALVVLYTEKKRRYNR